MNDTTTTTITHSSGKPVPQTQPFLLHLCRFFNETCKEVVKIGAAVGGVCTVILALTLGSVYAVGWVVLRVFSDPFEQGAGFNAIMSTGVGTFALIVLAAMPIGFLYIFLSAFRDIWKKTGREK